MDKMTDAEKVERSQGDEKKVKLVMKQYDEMAALRHGLEQVWEEDDQQFNNLIDEQYYKGNSDVKVPATYDAVETLTSFSLGAIYGRPVPIEKAAAEGGDIKKTKLYNRKSQIHMSNMPNNITMRMRQEEVLRRGFKHGVSVVKDPYNPQTKGADFIPIPNQELYYNFLVNHPYMIDYICHRMKRTHSKLLKNKANYNKGYNLTKAKLAAASKSNSDDRLTGGIFKHVTAAFKITDQTKEARKGYCDLYEHHFLYDAKGNGETEWYIALVVGTDLLIRFEKAEYDFPPFKWWIINKQEGTLLGKSIPRLVRPAQIELNGYRSQLFDAGTSALNPMYTADEMSEIDPYQVVNRPNGVVTVVGQNALNPIPRDYSFLSVAQQMEGQLINDIQVLSGATQSLSDVLAKSETAFKSKQNLANSTRRVLELYVKPYVDGLLSSWLNTDFHYTKEFVKYEDFMRIVGKDAAAEGKQQLKEYFDIPMDTVAVGFEEVTDKVVKIQESLNYLNIALKSNGVMIVQKAAMDVVEAMGKKNPEEYVVQVPQARFANFRDENELMLTGQRIDKPNPADMHQEHFEGHKAIEQQLTPDQFPVYQEHQMLHQQMGTPQGQGGRPSQEMPNPASGIPQPQAHGVEESEIGGQARRVPQNS